MGKSGRRHTVQVTADDIAKAHVADSYKCVVARAIARQVPNSRKIEVDLQTIRWTDDDGRHVFLTPYTVAGYIVAFDAGEELHPFSFQLRNAVPIVQYRAVSQAARDAKASRNRIWNERRRVAKAQAVLADEKASPERIAAAEKTLEHGETRIADARAEHEGVKAAYHAAGKSISEQAVSGTHRRIPKVYKTKRREYGARILRVNQAEDRKHYA